MGQAALSELVTQYAEGGVGLCLYTQIVQPPGAKGNHVNIHGPACGDTLSGVNAVTQLNWETAAGVPGRVLFSL